MAKPKKSTAPKKNKTIKARASSDDAERAEKIHLRHHALRHHPGGQALIDAELAEEAKRSAT